MFAERYHKKSIAEKAAALALFFAVLSCSNSYASLFGNSSSSKKNRNNSVQTKLENRQIQENEALAKLFDVEDKKDSEASDPYQFAQNHYSVSHAKLQTACRAISSFYNEPSTRDILQKVFIINTQFFKEDIKNSALAVKELNELNFNVNTGLRELSGVIASPGNETLEGLQTVIANIRTTNKKQIASANQYLTGTEKSIEISRAAYETFELIPSLSMPTVDMFIQSSKQLMRTSQSNAEAFKGLILNVISGCEQIELGLNSIEKNVKETIRYSDNFAVKQYPLINLPAPVREKIFVQLNSLANYVKGTENTISIGSSQVKNHAMQFSTIIGSFVDRSAESLKYQKRETTPLEQISTYARNQVNGLYLRVKEDIIKLRAEMYKSYATSKDIAQPVLETPAEVSARKTRELSANRLPLFLLGGKSASNQINDNNFQPNVTIQAQNTTNKPDMSNFIKLTPQQSTQDLLNTSVLIGAQKSSKTSDEMFSDDDLGFENEPKFEKTEISIISKELDNDFFFAEKGEDLSKSALIAAGEDMPNYEDDEIKITKPKAKTKNNKKKTKTSSYEISSDLLDPELEMLKFASE